MALFKIKRGLAANLPTNSVEGYCYVTTDDHKFYIDIADATTATGNTRICLNAQEASCVPGILTSKDNSVHYDGSANAQIPFSGVYTVMGTQTANTGSWTGTIAANQLYTGMTIMYYLPKAGSGNATLNLTLADGTTTGAKEVWYSQGTRMTTHFGAGATILLTYYPAGTVTTNGSAATTTDRWVHAADYDSTNIYQLRSGYGNWMAESVVYRYQLLAQVNENTLMPFNNVSNSTATTKTLSTVKFMPFGNFFYYNSTSTVNASAAIGASALYRQCALDLRYSFNIGTTLTAHKNVYLKTVYDSTTGLVSLDITTPVTQTLPTTADGFVYILLGQAYSTYQIEIYPIHPVLYYDAIGGLKPFIGVLDVEHGGTGKISWTQYGVVYATGTSALGQVANNTTSTKKFLRMTGNGSVAAAPVWDTVTKSDVGLSNVENTKLSTWAGSTNITTLGTIGTGTWNATTIAVNKGGTGKTSWTKFALVYANDVNSLASTEINATTTKKFLTMTGTGSVGAAPVFSTIVASDLPTSGATAGSYGPANTSNSPGYGGTFAVPYITVDTYGRITAVEARNIVLPASDDTKYTAGTGLSLNGTQFYVSSANVSTMMNLLSEGTSPAQLDDYLIAQYAGGGTTTTTYHRRKVSNVVNGTVVKAALGATATSSNHGNTFLRKDGTWATAIVSHQTIKQDGITGATINRFGVCATAGDVAAKTVSITSGTFALAAGSRITVKFTYPNTADNPTLNVNNSGAKTIMLWNGREIVYNDDYPMDISVLQGVIDFVYDGTYWCMLGPHHAYGRQIEVSYINSWTPNVPTVVTKKTVVTGGNTTNIPNVTSVGTAPSLTISSVACDDITAWNAGTATSSTYADGIVSVTNGTAPSLSYTARSIGSASNWSAGSVPTLGTAIKAYTSLSTGDSVSVTAGTSASLDYWNDLIVKFSNYLPSSGGSAV